MFGLTNQTSISRIMGRDHNSAPSGTASPLGPFKGMKPYGTANVIGGSTKPTDSASDENLLDKNRVHMQVPAYIAPNRRDFIFPQGAILFVWDSQQTITRDRGETYEVLTISGLNKKIRDRQVQGFSELKALVNGNQRPASSSRISVSRDLERSSAPMDERLMHYYFDTRALGKMINTLGISISDVTEGTVTSASILKQVGACIFVVIHEGRSDIGNMWEDLSTGAKANLALTKRDPINVQDPFIERVHQILPISSATASGRGAYRIFGIRPYNEMTAPSGKRSRIATQGMIVKKKFRGEITDHTQELEFVTAHSYNRFSLILNADLFDGCSATGTIGSLMRFENKLQRGKETDMIPTNLAPTFLDWSWSQYGPEYIVNPSSMHKKNSVYNVTHWNINRQQAMIFPIGTVTTAQRGRIPYQEEIKGSVLADEDNRSEFYRHLINHSKLSVHVRLQN